MLTVVKLIIHKHVVGLSESMSMSIQLAHCQAVTLCSVIVRTMRATMTITIIRVIETITIVN